MASRKQIANIIIAIKAIFSYYAKDGEYSIVASLWDKLLKPYSDEEVSNALYLCMQECKYPPTPADIIEKIKKNDISLGVSPTRAWAKLSDILYEVEELEYNFRFTITDANGMTEGEKSKKKCRELWENLPADIKEYVGSFGELLKMANLNEDELKFEKARFIKSFPQIQQRVMDKKALENVAATKFIKSGENL